MVKRGINSVRQGPRWYAAEMIFDRLYAWSVFDRDVHSLYLGVGVNDPPELYGAVVHDHVNQCRIKPGFLG